MQIKKRRLERLDMCPSSTMADTNSVVLPHENENGIHQIMSNMPSLSSSKVDHNIHSFEESSGSKPINTCSTIDTNLYSRQIGILGLETMGKLMKIKVLISGLKGLGIEIAKNLILAGPECVCLHDDNIVEMNDLGSNFCLKLDDVKKRTRSDASVCQLRDLNQYVHVYVHKGPISMELLRQFNVVVFTETKRSILVDVNNFCRKQVPNIGFITADIFGLSGSVFVDFGDDFICFDKDGEEPKSAIVAGITHETDATVHIHNDKLLPFQDGDYVTFREVQGMTEINGLLPMKIKVTGKHSFLIGDTTNFSPYSREGIVTQVKIPVLIKFKSYSNSCDEPIGENEDILMCPDMSKFYRSEQLHLITQSVQFYRDKYGRLPSYNDDTAVEECLEIVNKLNQEGKSKGGKSVSVENVDVELLKNVVKYASCHISPMAAFVGGIVAQEVVKFTGKFSPLHQWFYFDAMELMPKETPANNEPCGSRYDDQITLWGKNFQETLGNLNIFLVGAGALGCEHLKNFAMMGCCCGENGKLVVTDMDRIEISNLNRQFLFGREHVGMPKSSTAALRAIKMNSELNVEAKEIRVEQNTEDVFNDAFWDGLDIVVNALDNIQARQYVDTKCVWHLKPLMESGTLGTKGNVQVIIPNMTQCYNDSQDPPEESIPLCTLKHFPHAIEHTIEWARDIFQGIFTQTPQEVKMFINNPDEFFSRLESEGTLALRRETLEKARNLIGQCLGGLSIEKCVNRACMLFNDLFYTQISQLIYTFPLDHLDSGGQPFWSGPKRAPTPIVFDCNDETSLIFVVSAANLFAQTIGLEPIRDFELIKSIASKVEFEPFKPKVMKFKVYDRDPTEESAGDDETVKEALMSELRLMGDLSKIRVNVIEFEKDDDTNFHVDFITACANLRARNYRIPECDRHKVKIIAGKIIPAIATTTAMVTGLIGLEIMKTITYRDRKIDEFKNAFINLALPVWVFSEPLPSVKTVDKDYDPVACGPVKARPYGFTSWMKLDIKIPNCTIQHLSDYLGRNFNVSVSILSVGDACLYNAYLPTHKKSRLNKPILELTEQITKKKLPPGRNYVIVEASCSDIKDGIDVIIPTICLWFT